MKNPYKLSITKFSTLNIIRQLVEKNHIVLDIGCNTGYLGDISDKTNQFYGIDISKKNIAITKQKYEQAITYDLNNLKKLPWNIRFDVLVFADVLEHIYNPDKVLQFFATQYLSNNGVIIISLPNIANWFVRFKLLFGNFDYQDSGILASTHLHFYTFKTANYFVKKNGLIVQKVLFGSSVFGYLLNYFPYLKGLLSTGIILYCKKSKYESGNNKIEQ